MILLKCFQFPFSYAVPNGTAYYIMTHISRACTISFGISAQIATARPALMTVKGKTYLQKFYEW